MEHFFTHLDCSSSYENVIIEFKNKYLMTISTLYLMSPISIQ